MKTLTEFSEGARGARPTIHEVAELAQVSIATVSRVINTPDSVQPRTMERVRAAMEQLGYVPSNSGRALAQGKTGNLGVVMLLPPEATSSDIFFLKLLQGIETAATQAGLGVMVVVQSASDPREQRMAQLLASRSVDGLIVTGSPFGERHRAAIRRVKLPLVVIGSHEVGPNDWSIYADSRQGSEEAVRHLLAQGRKRVALITGPVEHAASRRKLEGYRQAHVYAGLEIDPSLHVVEAAIHSREGGQRAIESLLSADVPFDAIFAADDLLAIGALAGLAARGMSVPDDVAIVGWGDLEESRYTHPPLSSVHIDFRQLGWLGGLILARMVAGEDPPPARVKLETTLVARQSSAGGTITP